MTSDCAVSSLGNALPLLLTYRNLIHLPQLNSNPASSTEPPSLRFPSLTPVGTSPFLLEAIMIWPFVPNTLCFQAKHTRVYMPVLYCMPDCLSLSLVGARFCISRNQNSTLHVLKWPGFGELNLFMHTWPCPVLKAAPQTRGCLLSVDVPGWGSLFSMHQPVARCAVLWAVRINVMFLTQQPQNVHSCKQSVCMWQCICVIMCVYERETLCICVSDVTSYVT